MKIFIYKLDLKNNKFLLNVMFINMNGCISLFMNIDMVLMLINIFFFLSKNDVKSLVDE